MNSERMCKLAKILALESINNAGSGHSGIVLSSAEIFQALFEKHLKVCAKYPDDINRDRFVLSAGHGSSIYYAYLYILGYLSIDDLKNFRTVGSKTPGHPEITTSGVDASTGPLGQGIANAVGMAIADTMLSAREKDFGHYTYCLCGDGCLMEGVALEAISLAGHFKLNKFILLYDKNNTTLDSSLKIENTEDVKAKFLSCNFNVIECGQNIKEIDKAISEAKKSKDKPSVIICNTIIGKDSSKEDSNKAHGAVLSVEEIKSLRKKYELSTGSFSVPKDVMQDIKSLRAQKAKFKPYKHEKLKEFISANYEACVSANEDKSTRDWGGVVINEYAKHCPNLISLSADLFSSTKTEIKDGGVYSANNRQGRNLYMGIREHAMAGVANGIALHGGFKIVVSTFLSFCDYMRPAIRMTALMNLNVVYVFTHDSIVVGQDGATHQPIEQIDSLNLIPNLKVIRPCNRIETVCGFNLALSGGSFAIIESRQVIKNINTIPMGVHSGAYYVTFDKKAKANLIASGSEVELCVRLSEMLKKLKISVNVISCPCVKLIKNMDNFHNKKLKNIVISFGTGMSLTNAFKADFVENVTTFGISGKDVDVLEYFKKDINSLTKKIASILK